MKLRYSPTSPFVRKVTVTAIETGLDRRIERVATDIREPCAEFLAVSPLGKVPALTTSDGQALYDSAVICEYLDSLHDGPKLFPAEPAARFRVLTRMALADGILDAGVLRRMESLRPAAEQSQAWIERQSGKMTRGLDALEREVPRFEDALTIAQISIGCCLGWLEFRYAEEEWRIGRPMLADWYSQFMLRPSMLATVPNEG